MHIRVVVEADGDGSVVMAVQMMKLILNCSWNSLGLMNLFYGVPTCFSNIRVGGDNGL
jgi:hypothetical protein